MHFRKGNALPLERAPEGQGLGSGHPNPGPVPGHSQCSSALVDLNVKREGCSRGTWDVSRLRSSKSEFLSMPGNNRGSLREPLLAGQGQDYLPHPGSGGPSEWCPGRGVVMSTGVKQAT